MKHKISVLDTETYGNFFERQKPKISCDWLEYGTTNEQQTLQRIIDATIVIVNKVKLQKLVLEKAKNLKLIAIAATGYNNVDLDYCKQNNITVCNIQNYAFDTVPEHTFSLILALRKNLFGYKEAVAQGIWEKDNKFCFFLDAVYCLKNARLGIIGSGSLGQRVAKIAKSFEMEVFFAERKGVRNAIKKGYLSFEELIATCDVISIHCPLLPQTKNLIDSREFSQMKKTCILVNTARGGIINEKALVVAIKKKTIAAAGIDVVSKEPPSFSHPYYSIIHYPNFLLTPHTAWIGVEAIQRAWQQVMENIEAFCQGNPIRCL